MDYWLQLCYPSNVQFAARRMDDVLWQVLQVVSGSRIPRVDEGRDWHCVPVVPVAGLGGKTFQEWIVHQPIRFGGFGIRGQEDTVSVAFIGALEQSLTSFAGEDGVCAPLSHMVPIPGEASD